MRDIQMDPTASELVLVTLPEELPTAETLETLAWLDENPVIGSRSIVANRVLNPLETAEPGEGIAAEAASLHRSLVAGQRTWLDALPSSVDLPYLFGVSDPREISESISLALAKVLT